MSQITEFFIANWIELAGFAAAVIYLFFSIRQNIWMWICGIATSALYIWVYANAALYADMGLQVYYLVISVYGWMVWLKGGLTQSKSLLPVKHVRPMLWGKLFAVHAVIYGAILAILLYLPAQLGVAESSLPYLDALTTSTAIVATWMVARKYLENWLIWIFIDALSAGMYIYKELWITSLLFAIYTIAAIVGYYSWKRSMDINTAQ